MANYTHQTFMSRRLATIMNHLGGYLSGTEEDKYGLGKAVATVVGYTVLHNIVDNFIRKSRRGTDDFGEQWPELSPVTVANRKVGPGDMKDPAIAYRVKAKAHIKKYYYSRYLLTMSKKDAETMAEKVAEQMVSKDTGKTKLQTLGNRKVDILRDTGRLLNSLQPGQIVELSSTIKYKPPKTDLKDDQIFEPVAGAVTIDSNVEYAKEHQEGLPVRNPPLARRSFLPQKNDTLPSIWKQDIRTALETYMVLLLSKMLK